MSEGGRVNDLRERRIAKEISIAELARRAACSRAAIYQIERGASFNPTDDVIHRIENGLKGIHSKKRSYEKRHEITDPIEKAALHKIWVEKYGD